jgi:hypothetical protein
MQPHKVMGQEIVRRFVGRSSQPGKYRAQTSLRINTMLIRRNHSSLPVIDVEAVAGEQRLPICDLGKSPVHNGWSTTRTKYAIATLCRNIGGAES